MSSTHSSSQSAFDKALDRFRSESGLTVNEIKQMKMVTLGELQNTLATIQQDQRLQRKTRHLQRLQPFLDVMQQYSATVDIFAQTSDILAFIWVSCSIVLWSYHLPSTGSHEVHYLRKPRSRPCKHALTSLRSLRTSSQPLMLY